MELLEPGGGGFETIEIPTSIANLVYGCIATLTNGSSSQNFISIGASQEEEFDELLSEIAEKNENGEVVTLKDSTHKYTFYQIGPGSTVYEYGYCSVSGMYGSYYKFTLMFDKMSPYILIRLDTYTATEWTPT